MISYLISIAFIAGAFAAIYKIKMFGARGISKHWFAGAFALKLLAAGLMVLIYTRHYPERSKADIFRYYDDALMMHRLFPEHTADFFHFLISDKAGNPEAQAVLQDTRNWDQKQSAIFGNNRLIIRVNMLISLFSMKTYAVHMVVFSFFSFMGLFWIFRFFYRQLPERKWLIFLAVFGFPSIVFWSSGILKESLALFFIGLILNCGSFALKGRKPLIRFFMVLLGFFLLFQTRALLAILFLPIALAYMWNYLKPQRLPLLPYFILLFAGLSVASESKQITGTDFYGLLIEKRADFVQLAEEEQAGSQILSSSFEADSWSLISNSPGALVNSLFRPTPWEAGNALMWAAALENVLLFGLLLLIVIFPQAKIKNKNLLWMALLYALGNLLITGLTIPVLGAISRYRIIGLVFLLMAVIQLVEWEKIWRKR
jgi:hypothetical protein